MTQGWVAIYPIFCDHIVNLYFQRSFGKIRGLFSKVVVEDSSRSWGDFEGKVEDPASAFWAINRK